MRGAKLGFFVPNRAVPESEGAQIIFPADASRHLGMQKGDVRRGLASIVKGFQSVSILFCVSYHKAYAYMVQHGEKREKREERGNEWRTIGTRVSSRQASVVHTYISFVSISLSLSLSFSLINTSRRRRRRCWCVARRESDA